VLLFLLPTVLGLELLCWISVLPGMRRGGADFRQLYIAGYMVRTGAAARLYDYDYQLQLHNKLVAPAKIALPYVRPAYQAVLFAPLSLLSYRAAYALWTVVNVALLTLACFLLPSRFPELVKVWKLLPVGVICAFFPVWIALLQGQDTILLLILLSAAFLALEKDREALAGSLLALGLFKFQIILPIAFLFVAWKRWNFMKGFFGTALLLAAASCSLIGVSGIATFFDSVVHIHFPVRYEAMSNLHALLVGIFGNSAPVTLLTIALSAAVWLAIAARSPVRSGPAALVVAIPTAVLVSYYLFGHDWIVLLLPLLYTMNIGVHRLMQGWIALLLFAAPLLYAVGSSSVYWVTIPMALLLLAVLQSARLAPAADHPSVAAERADKLASHV